MVDFPIEKHSAQLLDVVIVGAGYAGLAAALRMREAGLSVVVLEAQTRVGGRIFTDIRSDGLVVDHGGQWVGPTQHRLLEWADRYGCERFPTYVDGDDADVWSDGGRRVGADVAHAPGLAEYDRVAAVLDELSRTVDLEQPWRTPGFAALDGMSIGDWFAQQTDDPDALMRTTIMVRGMWCAEPQDLSLFHALFYLAAGEGYAMMMETSGGAQDGRFLHGAGGPAKAAAAALGDAVILDAPVTTITHRPGSVHVQTADGDVLHARRVIVTVPPAAMKTISFEPALPADRQLWLAGSEMGRVAKIHAVYDAPFWRDDHLSGFVTIHTAGPLEVCLDNSPDDGSAGVLVAFIYGDRVAEWAALPADQRRAEVVSDLASAVGERAAKLTDLTEQVWHTVPWAGGGYTGWVRPGTWTVAGKTGWRTPVGPLHWAGTETSTAWNGYMEGAIRSGERAADEVIAALTDAGGR